MNAGMSDLEISVARWTVDNRRGAGLTLLIITDILLEGRGAPAVGTGAMVAVSGADGTGNGAAAGAGYTQAGTKKHDVRSGE